MEQGCDQERQKLLQSQQSQVGAAISEAQAGAAPYQEALQQAEAGAAPYQEALQQAVAGATPYQEAIQQAVAGATPYQEAIQKAIAGAPSPSNYEAYNDYQSRVINPAYQALNDYQRSVVDPAYQALNDYQRSVVDPAYQALNDYQRSVVNPAYEAFNRYQAENIAPLYGQLNQLPADIQQMSCDDVRQQLARQAPPAQESPAPSPSPAAQDTGISAPQPAREDGKPTSASALPPDFKWPETDEDWQKLTQEELILVGEELGLPPGWWDQQSEEAALPPSPADELADFNEIEELPPLEPEATSDELADFNEIEELPPREPAAPAPYTPAELQAGQQALAEAYEQQFTGELPSLEKLNEELARPKGDLSDQEYNQRQIELEKLYQQRLRLELESAPNNTIYHDQSGNSYTKLMPDGTLYTFEQKDFGPASSQVVQTWDYPDGKSATWVRTYEQQAGGSGGSSYQSEIKDETLGISYSPDRQYIYSSTEASTAVNTQLPSNLIQTPTELSERLDQLHNQHRHGPWAAGIAK